MDLFASKAKLVKMCSNCAYLAQVCLRSIDRETESCPRIALRAETRMVGMKHRIWEMKLLLLKRIKKQGTSSLSGQILEEQRSKNWPGLAVEVREICEELDIPDINIHDIPDWQIKKAVFSNH